MVAGKWRDSVSAFSSRNGIDFNAKNMGDRELPTAQYMANKTPPAATVDLRFINLKNNVPGA
jgi:hypothetical protein